LLLGTISIGINLIRHLQTVQLARDAGYMYARQVDFTQTATQTVLVRLGADLGLTTNAATSNATLILSAVKYVDSALCASDGKWNNTTNTSNGCTNYGKWVFAQRIVIGNTSLQSSYFGSPATGGSSPVTIDSGGNISLDAQVTNAGDVATSTSVGGFNCFAGIAPYQSIAGNASGLPSGQLVYLAEAAGAGFRMAPFSGGSTLYSFSIF